jgi:hypothetical protein
VLVARTMEGGVATGFRHVEPEQYEARLFKFAKDKNGRVTVREVSVILWTLFILFYFCVFLCMLRGRRHICYE